MTASAEWWPGAVAHYYEMCADWPEYANGRSLVTDAFRSADAVLEYLAADAGLYPSLELCVQLSDDGQHIRKWSRIPFEGGECLYSHPAAPAPDAKEEG